MIQKNKSAANTFLVESSLDSKKLQITVLTSKNCFFCHEAVSQAKEVAETLSKLDYNLDVVETSIDNDPSIIEKLGVISLPLTIVGNSRIIGISDYDAIEQLVMETILTK